MVDAFYDEKTSDKISECSNKLKCYYIRTNNEGYRLFEFAEKENCIFSLINTVRNMAFGIYKKKIYVNEVKDDRRAEIL